MASFTHKPNYDVRNDGTGPFAVFYCESCGREFRWLAVTSSPNIITDVTTHWDYKIKALKHHLSQIGDPLKFEERMRSRRIADSTDESPRYEEKFKRFIYNR